MADALVRWIPLLVCILPSIVLRSVEVTAKNTTDFPGVYSDCEMVRVKALRFDFTVVGYYSRLPHSEMSCDGRSVYRQPSDDGHYLYYRSAQGGWVIGKWLCSENFRVLGKGDVAGPHQVESVWQETFSLDNTQLRPVSNFRVYCTGYVLWPTVLATGSIVVLGLIACIFLAGVIKGVLKKISTMRVHHKINPEISYISGPINQRHFRKLPPAFEIPYVDHSSEVIVACIHPPSSSRACCQQKSNATLTSPSALANLAQ